MQNEGARIHPFTQGFLFFTQYERKRPGNEFVMKNCSNTNREVIHETNFLDSDFIIVGSCLVLVSSCLVPGRFLVGSGRFLLGSGRFLLGSGRFMF